MIQNLTLRDFRSYKNSQFSFSEKTNIILGKNGSGKTNILEAILVLCVGKSYRASDSDLIAYTKNIAKIKGVFSDKERSITLRGEGQKQYEIQTKKYKRLQFKDTIPAVLFEPEFMQIISRGPDTRRDYIDQILVKTNPGYQKLLSSYKRILTQRNNLLKSPIFSKDEMFVWNIKLSETGGMIIARRLQLISEINETVSDIYSNLANKKHSISLKYVSKLNTNNYTDSLLKGLEKNIQLDRDMGFTSLGPHREDVDFLIDGKSIKLTASRGETRTILLSLKIIESKLVEKAREQKPILLLDDVFSELDETRQGKLVEFFYDNQVIITTTNITPLMHGVTGKIIEL